MPSVRQQKGKVAEDRAVDFLHQKKYEVLGRHVTSRFGEIDILARDGDTLVAVEVKYRSDDAMGRAVESVSPSKLKKIHAALEDYCARENITSEKIRIDIVTIDGNRLDHLVGVS